MTPRARRWILIGLRWLVLILLVIGGFLFWDYQHDRAPAGAPMGEQITANEDYLTAEIIDAAVTTSVKAQAKLIEDSRQPGFQAPSNAKASPGFSFYQYNRDAHAKGHGCVMASFTVNNQVNSGLAYGVFGHTGHTYKAMIRYSNGNPSVQSDSAKDPRGMALKLFGVEGTKLLDGEENDGTQDFIMMNNPVFFIRTIEEYAELNHLLASGDLSEKSIIFAYFMHGPNILRWHLREMFLALGAGKPRPDSLLTTRYWSASAYALGPQQYVKYSAIPCAQNKPKPMGNLDSNPDYLRLELAKQSEQGGACFDFAVQAQVLGKNMPVEDTTVEWKESDSPFVPVARIVIDATKNNTEAMNLQCENTAFNPWHSLPDHRPVGVMNRVRKALYAAMSRFRQQKNCANQCDRTCNALNLPDSACASQ